MEEAEEAENVINVIRKGTCLGIAQMAVEVRLLPMCNELLSGVIEVINY